MRLLPAILAMAAIVVASNILVQFVIAGGLLTWGAFTYPFSFLLIDLTNRAHGPRAARIVVFWGFLTGVLCSLVGSQVEIAPGVPAVALRVAVASGAAFLGAQFLDVAIFHHFRRREWWRAPLASTFVSSSLDTLIFFALAFAATLAFLFPASANEATAWAQGPAPLLNLGPDAPLWASLALADLGVKIALALVTMLPYRLMTRRLQHRVS
ncbi:queuosine precursor transporter [Rubellimicrobium aerolatum]|uniref:Probable queuosine precursor transporter n=1 Tax=Rubellimicrobium aerolatum TaxID=490979 RepID=A0ABW0SI11_9RHOB|nr:queuosine precursor transporter [Rubellimicrobium aerolatum]MBP1807704.1 putative integral membrane protein (TIGR00697 family) [Rubellimicrobium aerolatum]